LKLSTQPAHIGCGSQQLPTIAIYEYTRPSVGSPKELKTMQESRQRKWFVAMLLVIVLASVVLIAGAAELISRTLETKTEGGVSQLNDPHLGWLPKPGNYKITTAEYSSTVSINSLNMNDREVIRSDLQRENRILALGDS